MTQHNFSIIGAFVLSWIVVLAVLLLPVAFIYIATALYYPQVTYELLAQSSQDGVLVALGVMFNALALSIFTFILLYRKHPALSAVATFLSIKLPDIKACVMYVGLLIVFFVVGEYLTWQFDSKPMDFMNHLVTEASLMPLVLAVVVIAPFYEELLFRGLLLGAWQNPFNHLSSSSFWGLTLGQWCASVLVSILFISVHLQYDVLGLMLVFGLSMIVCHARLKHGLWLSILLHFINNATAMTIYLLERTA